MNIESNIYNFSNYRDFLKDRYAQLKDLDPAFSFRYFSKQAGFGSPNYLKLVMDGKRNLSEEAIGKFAKGLRLDNHESEYFKFMVQSNQCTDIHRKRVYEAKLLYLNELFKVKDMIPELYDYYHDWYHAAIREKVTKGKMKNDPKVIGESLVPAISMEQARDSINLLKRLGFITEVANGWLEVVKDAEETNPNTGMAQKIYHEQMAELAAQSLYTQGPDTLRFESVTVSLPADKVEELKSKIAQLVEELVQESKVEKGETSVYQFNIQLFALSKTDEEGMTAE